MTGQHVVEVGGVRLTRLPVGRAEGHIWLTFVGTGRPLRLGDDGDFAWRLGKHVRVSWPDGRRVERLGGGAGGGDGLLRFDLDLRDNGGSSLVLEYVDETGDVAREVVTIPD